MCSSSQSKLKIIYSIIVFLLTNAFMYNVESLNITCDELFMVTAHTKIDDKEIFVESMLHCSDIKVNRSVKATHVPCDPCHFAD
jgi:hypothetical protein